MSGSGVVEWFYQARELILARESEITVFLRKTILAPRLTFVAPDPDSGTPVATIAFFFDDSCA